MINLTMDQIRAAQAGETAAKETVVREIEPRVAQLARRYATNGSGTRDWEAIEDFEQMGHLSLLESLSRFNGSTVAEFFKFVDTTVSGVLTVERRRNQRQGVPKDDAWAFEKAIKVAKGDPYEAEKLVQDESVMGSIYRILSPERAYAARISWQGFEFTAGTDEEGDEVSLFDIKADDAGHSYEIDYESIETSAAASRPITWVVPTNALNRLAKTPRGADDRETLLNILARTATGYVRESDVEWLADNVTVGARDVADAVALLRSLTFTDSATVPEDLRNAADGVKDSRAVTAHKVHSTLRELDDKQAEALRLVYGLDKRTEIGHDPVVLAEALGIDYVVAYGLPETAGDNFRTVYEGGSLPVWDDTNSKVCRKCDVRRPLTDFYLDKRGGKVRARPDCKPCKRGSVRKFAVDNPEKRAEQKRDAERAYRERKTGKAS